LYKQKYLIQARIEYIIQLNNSLIVDNL